MKTTTKTFSFLLSIFTFAATAQPISISGKVTDKSGSPISGAIVALVRQGLMDTTGADGAFLLAKSSATAAAKITLRLHLLFF